MRSVLYDSIFSEKFYREKKAEIDFFFNNLPHAEQKCQILWEWYKDLQSGKVQQRTEEQQKSEFLDKIFGKALGYEGNEQKWFLEKEYTFANRSTADGVLGFFGVNTTPIVKVAIEIKRLEVNLDRPQAQRQDNFTPVEQGFYYASQAKDTCEWVIVSNFNEIRLYHYTDTKRYESFLFAELFEEQPTPSQLFADRFPLLKRFFYLLHQGQLFNNLPAQDIATMPTTKRNYTYRVQRLEDITLKFYNDYKKYRKKLFLHLQQHNPHLQLPEHEALALAHKIFDRLIFMRFAQEVGITKPAILDNFLRTFYDFPSDRPVAWSGTLGLFTSFDEGYKNDIPPFNGELFKPLPVLEQIIIHNDLIIEILQFLLSYDFKNELKVDILGHIFENSLTEAQNPAINLRRQDGIFYTPEYITDFIIQETLMRYLQEQKHLIYNHLEIDFVSEFELDYARWQLQNPMLQRQQALELYAEFYAQYKQILQNIKVLDPACGSGAFLTRVFDYLLKEHELILKEEEKFEQKVYENFLAKPVAEKKPKTQKALRNMFAEKEIKQHEFRKKLSLVARNIITENLFGMDLNHESTEITKLSLWLKMANRYGVKLANLKNNIQQGNSLLKDAITQQFDIIVGNPPYFPLSTLSENILQEYQKNYQVFEKTTDIYALFFEKSIQLLKPKGLLGFITSRQWLSTNYGKTLRQYFVQHTNPLLLVDFAGLRVFKDATVDSSILVLQKAPCLHQLQACVLPNSFQLGKENLPNFVQKNIILLNNLHTDRWIIANNQYLKQKEKIRNAGTTLKEWKVEIFRGIITGLNEAFIIDEATKNRLIAQDKKSEELLKPVLRGRDVHQYYAEWQNLYMIVTKNGIDISRYPAILAHLESFAEKVKSRQDQGENWWNLRACTYYHLFEGEKIIYPETTVRRSEFYLDRSGMYIDKTCFMLTGEHLAFLTGVLSSSLMEWFLESELRPLGKNTLQYSKQYMLNIPLPKIENVPPELYAQVVQCVEKLHLLAGKRLQSTTEYARAKQTLDATINQLYGIDHLEI
ncbi:MAG: BREX-1 system adenine-specific DNA-methyltransferase PglX [Microscillaceae bacterium]|nr:BREX-1 system adenine-specific DNA-methyltransferase PglX [Microscillaceae bacterium]MDW8461393.1 N-6 DNA methylase [Cytophagales bacterium]